MPATISQVLRNALENALGDDAAEKELIDLLNNGVVNNNQVTVLESVTGLSKTDRGNGVIQKTTLTLAAVPLAITDALAYSGKKLFTFPQGRIRVLDCVVNLAFTTTSAIAGTLNSGATVSLGIGSVTASSITLATTMQNFMPGSGEAVKNFTSSTVINVAAAAVTGFMAAVAAAQLAAILDGTTTPVAVFLNLGVPTNTEIDADATLTVTGTIEFTWINDGDF